MIAVIGATGTIGRPVVAGLTQQGIDVRALTRNATAAFATAPCTSHRGRIETVVGSAAERAVLDNVIAGCDRVFLSMTNSPDQEAIETGVIEACADANVQLLVKVSAPDVSSDVPVAIAQMHGRLERAATDAGLTCCFLRPFGYMQNLENVIPQIIHTGSFIGSSGNAPLNFVDARDIADVAVDRLTRPDASSEALVLTGPQAYTRHELADLITGHGIPATYVDLDPDAHRGALRRAQLPPWLIDHLVEIDALAVERPQQSNDVIETALGHPARTLDDFLDAHFVRFRDDQPDRPASANLAEPVLPRT